MDIYESASKGSGWLKFFGVVNIIAGGLQALTIVGIIIAWVPIWIGVVAMQAASIAEKVAMTKSEADLIEYHNKIRFLFQLIGIFLIIGIVLGIILAIFGIIFSALLSSLLSGFEGSSW